MDFYALEAQDAVRFSWNIVPPNKLVATRAVVPLGCLYSPMKDLEQLPLLEYKPLKCESCQAVINPFGQIDYKWKMWTCVFCHNRNKFPKEYADNISESNLPAELMQQYTSIEYQVTPPNSATLPQSIYLFLIDTCVIKEELYAVRDAIQQSINFMPPNTNIGLITFGRFAFVHELSFTECPKSYAFRGDKEYPTITVLEKLGIAARNDPRGPQATGALKKFIVPISECETVLNMILDDIQPDPWVVPSDERPQRCLGNALSIAVSLLEAAHPNQGSRIVSFLGGPGTMGNGQTVGVKLEETIRNWVDLQKDNDNCKHFKKAQKFYQTLTQRAIKSQQVIDIFGFTLDQFGLLEMKTLSEKTGGYSLINEQYNSKVFRDTFKKVFEKDANGDLKFGFCGDIQIHVSKDLRVSGAIGPCTSLKKTSPQVSETEIGQGGTVQWYLGGLDRNTTVAFYLDLPASGQGADKDKNPSQKSMYVQFVTQYRHANGKFRLRVSTISRRFADLNNIYDLVPGFDQEAACVIMSRLAISKTEQEEPIEVIRWLDRSLIRLVARFADYKKEDMTSFRMPKEFQLYPQFMYHLRRSTFVQTFGASPDESAYYRAMISRENTTNCLVMIQPALLMYTFDNPTPVPVLLDIDSMKNNVILLLDTFFYVVVWHGEHIHKWKEAGYDKEAEYANFKSLLSAPIDDAKLIIEDRYPAPNFLETYATHGKERYLKSKVNPSSNEANNSVVAGGDFINDDASLKMFMDHLVKLVCTSTN